MNADEAHHEAGIACERWEPTSLGQPGAEVLSSQPGDAGSVSRPFSPAVRTSNKPLPLHHHL